ncbi:MAG: zinc-dependent peptidase [Flammeovirgaceae bacterium]|nr:MAG: zinc-dependent peptidase [Flammeovirgaceae bacterium]
MITIIILVGVVSIIYQYRTQVEEAYRAAGRAAAPLRSAVLPFPAGYRDILNRYFPYYKKLSSGNRHSFEQKLLYFILSKKWIPRQFDTVTDEMKVMISACAVQLTFGLPRVYLQHFIGIVIYPDNYYSSITKRFHKGEVNPAYHLIVLSWKSFVDGYLVHPTDAINVGLHELAHALRLENLIRNDEYRFFDEELLNKFDAYAYRICHEADPELLFFRPYACTNEHEFFSVAVENFFERPQEFKTALPQLYEVLAKLLNQDPLVLTGDQK